jgi:hypothetical protein
MYACVGNVSAGPRVDTSNFINSLGEYIKMPQLSPDDSKVAIIVPVIQREVTLVIDTKNLNCLGLHSWRGLGIFLFATMSRTALEPTQPPIQWVPGALSLGVKLPGREADTSI